MLSLIGSLTRRTALAGLAGGTVSLLGFGRTAGAEADEKPGRGADRGTVGTGSWDVRVPDDFDSVQAALDAAEPGDTIGVADGRYEGGVTLRTDGVTLAAARGHAPVIDASGDGTGVAIRASDVTVEGFEIVGDDETTSGVSIVTSDGATNDIDILDNHIHGMKKAGGGGPLSVSSWGILSYGNEPLSGVRIEGNHIERIGGGSDAVRISYQNLLVDPIGIGIDLEEVDGDRHGEGAVVRGNRVNDIRDGSIASVTLPGIGIAVQPLNGGSSGADASATDVTRNEIAETSFSVLLGNSEHARVWQNVDRLTN